MKGHNKLAMEQGQGGQKRTRRWSEMTKDTRWTNSTLEDSPGKRKVSFDHSKQQPQGKGGREGVLDARCKFKLSSEVLSFEMEEQRVQQLRAIGASPALLAYFNCLKKLFMILYQASIPLRENRYNIRQETLLTNNLQILAVIFGQDSREWDFEYVRRLETFAQNMGWLCAQCSEFERRIELVAIKATLHNEKRAKIEKAFLNSRIEECWEVLEGRFGEWEVFGYLEDQFERAEEKLCFVEVQEFVRDRLATPAFTALLRQHCQLEEIDHDMNFSFKFEFFLAEELCFNSLQGIFKDQPQQPPSLCHIM